MSLFSIRAAYNEYVKALRQHLPYTSAMSTYIRAYGLLNKTEREMWDEEIRQMNPDDSRKECT